MSWDLSIIEVTPVVEKSSPIFQLSVAVTNANLHSCVFEVDLAIHQICSNLAEGVGTSKIGRAWHVQKKFCERELQMPPKGTSQPPGSEALIITLR